MLNYLDLLEEDKLAFLQYLESPHGPKIEEDVQQASKEHQRPPYLPLKAPKFEAITTFLVLIVPLSVLTPTIFPSSVSNPIAGSNVLNDPFSFALSTAKLTTS